MKDWLVRNKQNSIEERNPWMSTYVHLLSWLRLCYIVFGMGAMLEIQYAKEKMNLIIQVGLIKTLSSERMWGDMASTQHRESSKEREDPDKKFPRWDERAIGATIKGKGKFNPTFFFFLILSFWSKTSQYLWGSSLYLFKEKPGCLSWETHVPEN